MPLHTSEIWIPQPVKTSAKAVLLTPGGKVFTVIDSSGAHNLVGGGVDPDERVDPFLALVRETGEEVPGARIEDITPVCELNGKSRHGHSLRWLIFSGTVRLPHVSNWRLPGENLGYELTPVQDAADGRWGGDVHPMAALAVQICLMNPNGLDGESDLVIPSGLHLPQLARDDRQKRAA